MLHIYLYSLPNNLAERKLIPEYIQSNATTGNLGQAVGRLLTDTKEANATRRVLKAMHRALQCKADVRAAQAVIRLLPVKRRNKTPKSTRSKSSR